MRYSMVAAPLALAAGASAWGSNVTYTTEVVTEYTTFCPGPTSIVHNQQTYTVTEATTLTITDCPCTITKPVPIAPQTSAAVPAPPAISSAAEVPPVIVDVPSSAAPAVPATETPVENTPAPASPAPSSAAPVPPFPIPSSVAPAPPAGTATGTPFSVAPVSPETPAASPFTGAGNKVAASGFTLAALAGLAAFIL